MNLVCPFCSSKFRALVQEPLRAAVRLECPACRRSLILRPNAASTPAAAEKPRRRAMLIDDARPFRNFLQQQLEKMGFEVQLFDLGDEALKALRERGADLLVANVYLKHGKMGVELAEEIRKDEALRGTRVALTGPLFRANRFRSDPATLYGADEYIEEQIPARELERRIGHLFHRDGEAALSPADEQAQRLARLILSDIVISHPDRVDQALRSGTFLDALKKEIDEGRTYYEAHVPYNIRQYAEHYNETFQSFAQAKSEEL